MEKPPIDALLFDLDGTLVDTWRDIVASLNHALAALGRPRREAAEVRGMIGDGIPALLRKALGSAEGDEFDRGLDVLVRHYTKHCADNAVLYPGVRETLARLSGKRLAIVTNKLAVPTRALLAATGIDRFFPVVLGGDSLPTRKPSPEPLREAARRLGISPERTLMVGDSAGDIRAGKAAGVRTCAVVYGYRPREELLAMEPNFLVERFEDLEAIAL